MSLASGTRIGPYEVLAPLGSGGMGEVFRARDTRLGREVALKTLPPAFAQDRERLERFEREARTAGSLQHPGIVTVFDIGTHEGRPYIVSELVEGESLRVLIQRGALKPARALEIATALAEALAAAHARGIVHRDLKPENVVIARDGRVKLLDFGLAKLVQRELPQGEDTSARTLDGTLLGTAAYMAPEQARGGAADHRADLFALGCVLHEMLSGRSPFHRDSPVETLAALLKEEPPALPAAAASAVPGLELLLRRCMEKQPADRFESARDLAVALEALRLSFGERQRAGAGAVGPVSASDLVFRRLTYRRGRVLGARFTPDGHGVVYSAAWEGQLTELFWVFGGATESRPLGIRDASLLAVSRASELAIASSYRPQGAFIFTGMLARVSLGAGTPRDVQPGVQFADWSADGTQLAAVMDIEGSTCIQYPLGHTIYRSDGWISEPRVSRDGTRVAFLDHPIRGDDGGWVCVVDPDGRARRLARYEGTLRGLAWSPDGREIWFTGAPAGVGRALRATTLDGESRLLLQIAGALTLHDVSADGRALVTHGDERVGIQFSTVEPREDRDLSWFDWSLLRDLSRDGRMILFDESGEGGGESRSVYVRATDGSPAIKLGDAVGMGFSPDEKWVVGVPASGSGQLVLLPIGAGSARTLRLPDYEVHLAGWMPDGRSLWATANRPGEALRVVRIEIDGERITPLTGPGVGVFEGRPTADGRFMLFQDAERTYRLYPIEGGEPVLPRGMLPGDRPANWTPDGRRLFVYERGAVPTPTSIVDLETGERQPWRVVGPSDPSGIFTLAPVRISSDANSYAFSYGRLLIDLFEVRGLQ
jgi:hypothetical protein